MAEVPAPVVPEQVSERGWCCYPDDPQDCGDRANCPTPGAVGHYFCGTCTLHGEAVHTCGCSKAGAR